MSDPINLFWWKPVPNFGDHLNPHVVEHVSGRAVKHSWAGTAQVIAIGSVLASIKKSRTGKPLYVWGTGAMNPDRVEVTENAVFCAVRGALTAKALGLKDIPLGDPGLLVSDFVPREETNRKVGIVLHHSQNADTELSAFLAENEDKFCLISPLRQDPLEVVREISACSCIFSSSLHGMVVADAYGIPNEWIAPEGIHMRPRFKFKDYASAIGRKLRAPVKGGDLIAKLSSPFEPGPTDYFSNIASVKADLRNAFPSEIV